MVRIEWVKDPVTAWMPGYRAWVMQLHTAVGVVLQRRVPEMIDWMTTNAIWDDRTGLARESLTAALEEQAQYYLITLSYGGKVPYARYLEFDHQGKFAILEPALNYWGPILLNDLREAFR